MKHRLSMSLAVVVLLGAGCGGDPAPSLDSGSSGPVDSGPDGVDAPGLDAPMPGADAATSSGVLIRAADGGLVESADGLFEIWVSPGALAEDTTITITRVPDAEIPSDIAAESPIGGVYSVEPDGLTFPEGGAWGHFIFDPLPAALIVSSSPPRYRAALGRSRPQDGGPIEAHGQSETLITREAARADVVVALEHLSFQFLTDGYGFEVQADLGGPRRTANWPWVSLDFGIWTNAVDGEGAPLQDVSWGSGARVGVRDDTPTPPASAGGPTRSGLSAVGLVDELSTNNYSLGTGDPGAAVRSFTPPTLHFSCLGDGVALATANVRYPWTRFGVGRSTWCSLTVQEEIRCTWPPVEARVTERTTCIREGDLIDCTAPPVSEAEVRVQSPSTTVHRAPGGSFILLTPAGAPPPASVPSTISAQSSGSDLLVTHDPGTFAYIAAFEDEATFALEDPIDWSIDGGAPVQTPPPPAQTFHFGPVITPGLDTDIVVDSEEPGARHRVMLTFEPGSTLSCAGVDYPSEGLQITGHWFSEDLGDGTRGIDAPVRHLVDDAAAFCEIAPTAFESIPFHIDIVSASELLIDGPIPVSVSTTRTASLDSASLLASCPAGRTYCTDACVATNTPMNCGGCGLMPTEICDGVDNDCDGRVDDGCPNLLTAPSSALIASPSFGEGVGGSSELSTICPYPSVATSLCGNIDTAGAMPTGNVRALRLGCGLVTLVTDRSTTPWTYSLQVAASPPCSTTGGGSSGGMAFDFPCPPGEVLEGINVVAGSHIGQIQARCARWEILPSGGTWIIARTGTSTSPMFGTGSGTPDGWVVPARSTSGFPGVILRLGGRYEVPGTFVRVETGGAWYSLTYR